MRRRTERAAGFQQQKSMKDECGWLGVARDSLITFRALRKQNVSQITLFNLITEEVGAAHTEDRCAADVAGFT